MNPAINPDYKWILSVNKFGDKAMENLSGNELPVSESLHHPSLEFFEINLPEPRGDDVREDNQLSKELREARLKIASPPKFCVSIGGVQYALYRGAEGSDDIYAIPAFGSPLNLGSTPKQMRERLQQLRRASTWPKGQYEA